MPTIAKSRNATRRDKKKQARKNGGDVSETESEAATPVLKAQYLESEPQTSKSSILDNFSIDSHPHYAEFKAIFDRFQGDQDIAALSVKDEDPDKGKVFYDEDDNIPDEDDPEDDTFQTVSKSQQKRLNRLNVAELKQLVKRPEVVEWTDVSAQDPKLLVSLKSIRNTVPVPAHWSQKRDYLAGKRGVEKASFELPDFIRATGVGEMRAAAQEARESQTLKQQMRQRVQPKMGRLDIDYQKLHDAFFRFQTKPPMSKYGETYFEGKEFETNTREKRPGELSEDLKDALNIPPGAPPPWLINMQRFGPPPSYPSLKISGLNCPIPSGAQWGFHPGGWGKPPVDEYNRPLYGDVFGILQVLPQLDKGEVVHRDLWGELEEAEDESEPEEEESDEEDQEMANADGVSMTDGLRTPGGLATPSGLSSVTPSGIATPDHIELRKQRAQSQDEDEDEDYGERKTLYQVLPEKKQNVKGFYGSSHGYDLSGAPVLGDETRKRRKEDVDIALDPDSLTVDKEELERRYAEEREDKSGKPAGWEEDLSEMVSEQAAKSAAKRQKSYGAQTKKKEKFKF